MSLLIPSQRNIHVPVLRLHRDVFLFIIKLNADMFSNPTALSDARRASQVCGDWRATILEAPSLWGKLLDLDNLVYSADDWRDTVLERSGNASLWIRATRQIFRERTSVQQKIYEFLFSVLDNNWERTEKLVVYLGPQDLNHSSGNLFTAQLLGSNGAETHRSLPRSSNILFANHAPLLHTFHVAEVKFNLHASWVTNIRSIHIGPPFTLFEMLSVFKMMPHLENISVDEDEFLMSDKKEVDHRQSVNLPNLSRMQLCCDFKSSVTFLENLTHARGCFLELYTFGNWVLGLFQPLSKFALDYFTMHVPTSLSLEVGRIRFSFEDRTDHPAKFQRLSITIGFVGLPLPTPATGPIIAGFTFSMPVFHFVTQLYLPDLDCSPSETDYQAFFRSLPAVTTLVTNEHVIGNFFGMQEESSDSVKLDTLDDQGSSGYLFQFLLARRESAHPILVLDLMEINPDDFARALTYPAEFTGMQVLWRRWELLAH
ncbi:hypothetical protein GALMADRAFT_1364092 [Galerina marginata CBS 339.88]|uniref:F-box domain-containing protein n=1 Tax=Galerina marginata (strain CBS 339.88) TaxID=685588 RepID=A0A067TB63_GALM3|nr:hypothetical protein GALMADRAFT_1364092 [Galerina marginata CBS 339.88]